MLGCRQAKWGRHTTTKYIMVLLWHFLLLYTCGSHPSLKAVYGNVLMTDARLGTYCTAQEWSVYWNTHSQGREDDFPSPSDERSGGRAVYLPGLLGVDDTACAFKTMHLPFRWEKNMWQGSSASVCVPTARETDKCLPEENRKDKSFQNRRAHSTQISHTKGWRKAGRQLWEFQAAHKQTKLGWFRGMLNDRTSWIGSQKLQGRPYNTEFFHIWTNVQEAGRVIEGGIKNGKFKLKVKR